MGKPLNDLTGSRFGALVALCLGEKQRKTSGAWWMCACDCGTVKHLPSSDLVAGKISSCGCQHRQRIGNAGRTHGKSKSRTYRIWQAMLARTRYGHPDYAGRGIFACQDWQNFENFFADMGEAPVEMTLDRIDVNGNYEKSNCRWATRQQQSNNTRANVLIEWGGKRQTRAQWERELGMRPTTLRSRLRAGWPIERAMQPLAWLAEGNVPLPADEVAE